MSGNKMQIANYDVIDIKTHSLNLQTLNSLIIQNSPDSIYFGEKTLNSLINLQGSDLYEAFKSRTCLCKNGSNYANGSIFKYNDRLYVLTCYDDIGSTGTSFDILVNNLYMLRCNIAGIDRLSNLMVGQISLTDSSTTFYGSDTNKTQNVMNQVGFFELGTTVNINPFINPIQILNGENVFMVFHNIYDSPTFAHSYMLNNNYKGNLLSSAVLEGFIFEHRPNSMEGCALIFNSQGKIIGAMTQQLNNQSNPDRNISVGISSNIIRSILYRNIAQYYDITPTPSSNITNKIKNLPILNGFLGFSYYPITPADTDYSALIQKLGNLGGLRILGTSSNYLFWYNNTDDTTVSFAVSIPGGTWKAINNPVVRADKANGSDSNLYNRSNAANKAVLTSITFYSTLENANISLNLGRYEGQQSLSRFIYEYGPDTNGLWRDITIVYTYYSGGSWQNIIDQIITSKLTAYKGNSSGTVNYSATQNFVLPNLGLLNNAYNSQNLDLSSYISLSSAARFPASNSFINYLTGSGVDISGWYVIVYIYADQPGILYFQRDDEPAATQNNYTTSMGYKRFQFLLNSGNSFNLYYQNGSNAQTYFKMETVIAQDQNIVLQQTTQTPAVLGPNENMGLYQYQNSTGTSINSINYKIATS